MTPRHNYAERRDAARELIRDHTDIDALLVTDLRNIRYLTGFSGSNAMLYLTVDGAARLLTDGRYTTQIKAETGEPEDLDIEITNRLAAVLAEHRSATGHQLGVEGSLSVAQADLFTDIHVTDGLIEGLRLIKSPSEAAALRAAAELADGVWEQFLADEILAVGVREIDAAAELEFRLRKAGADSLSFDTILAGGDNAAKPHAGVTTRELPAGLVTLDFGVYLDGYASDQTRTVCLGTPDDTAQEIYDVVLAAQRAGEAAAVPGTPLREVDSACRDIITEAGYGEYFVHSTGHGVGLDVHEGPGAAQSAPEDSVLKAGMSLTVEPGIYLPGRTGVRLENTLLITEDGNEPLQRSSTELHIIDAG